jgi:glycosyltransferase involved in cell wall biosynthesis
LTRVSVIVPAFNAARTLGETLAALALQDLQEPFEVIVVDDGSDDGTIEVARAAAGDARVLPGPHGGPGPARNAGAREAGAPVLAFTDADCVPTSSWLREGLAALEGSDLVQGAVKPEPGAERRPFDRTVWVTAETGLYECANLFLRREHFERLGGFEDFLGARVGKPLAEDTWLGWRARRAGMRTRFADDVLVHHAVFPRSAGDYALERVRLLYFPAIVRKIPELRDTLLYRRWFLNRRTASFDLALAAAAVALLSGSLLPLIAAAPYAWMLVAGAARWRRRAPVAALGDLAADVVSFVALVVGSLRRRTVVG